MDLATSLPRLGADNVVRFPDAASFDQWRLGDGFGPRMYLRTHRVFELGGDVAVRVTVPGLSDAAAGLGKVIYCADGVLGLELEGKLVHQLRATTPVDETPPSTLLSPRPPRNRTKGTPEETFFADSSTTIGPVAPLFVSYRRVDASASAGRLFDALVREFGAGAAFMDTETMQLGTWPLQLDNAVRGARAILVVIGSEWLTAERDGRLRIYDEDDWVRREVATGLSSGKLVVPVLVDGQRGCPVAASLPTDIRALPQRQHVELRHDSWTVDLQRLISLLRRRLRLPQVADRMPLYADRLQFEWGEQLEALYQERAEREAAGVDVSAITEQILTLRREQRSGPELVPGVVLSDRYRLLSRLGSGGFATVWAAYDKVRRREVAVKILHSQYASNSERVERFYRGARLMHKHSHPHVVAVLEPKAEDAGYRFFVMELVPGGDLGQAIEDQRFSPDTLLDCVEVVAETLGYAHSTKPPMVHRDVKPENILLTMDGEPKLSDFDLVRAGDTTGGTRTGGLGTFLYAAPEALTDASRVDPAADVYSLAMTAVVALRGSKPDGALKFSPDRLVEGLPVSPPVQAVLRSALSIQASERPPNATAFVRDLRTARIDVAAETLPPVVFHLDGPSSSPTVPNAPYSVRGSESITAELPELVSVPDAPASTLQDSLSPDLTDELDEVQFFLDVGDEAGAVEALRELVEHYPTHPEVVALTMVLDVETVRGKPPRKAPPVDFDEVPKEIQDTYNMGMALIGSGRHAKAIEAFERAALWPPFAEMSKRMLVRCYVKVGDPDQAAAQYRGLEALGVPKETAAPIKYLIGDCYEQIGNVGEAFGWFQSCADDDPSYQDVQARLEETLSLLERDRAEDPTDVGRGTKISYL